MLLVIDNYDSFTYNLVQMLAQRAPVMVKRNDEIDVAGVGALAPEAIVISPGPGRPEDSGCIVEVIRAHARQIPILGVCLGMQALGYAFGADIVRAGKLMHGKTSRVYHHGSGVFHALPNPFTAMRYHSLVVEPNGLPPELELTAYTSDGEIMGLALAGGLTHGVQFHPESILTEQGAAMIGNFLRIANVSEGARV